MEIGKTCTVVVCCRSFPYDFISEVIFSENLIHQHLHIMSYMPVQMNINTCRIAHHTLDGHQIFVHPVQIAFLVPNVTVHLLLKGFQLFHIQLYFSLSHCFRHFGVPPYINLLRIIRPAGERGIDIYQIHTDAFIF